MLASTMRRSGASAASASASLCLCALLLLASSIAVSVSAQQSQLLLEGDSLDAFVAVDALAYFKIQIPTTMPADATTITINVTPLGDGDPDLYADWVEFPTSTRNTYHSWAWGEDTIPVPVADAAGHDFLFITVQPSMRASNFSIAYTIDQPLLLTDGRPQDSFVHKGALAPFKFRAQQRATVSVTISGQTKVYVSTTPSAGPTNTMWQSSFTSGAVTIPAADERFPADGQFYLAVSGLDDAYFTISARLNGTALELSNGQPISAQLEQNDNAYYKYHVGTSGCQLQIILSPISGDPDLLVSQTVLKPNPSTCDATACQSSQSYGADQVMYDPAPVGDFNIGVNSYTDSSYTVLAQTVCPDDSFNSSATRLLDGVSQHGALPARKHRFYSFLAPAAATDITITLSARLGDPDIYIATSDWGREPSRTSFQWASSHIGDDTVVISKDDGRACTPGSNCRYFIFVYSFSESDFYISASTPTTQILLFEGQPQTGSLQTGQTQYYAISVFIRADRLIPVVISVTDLGSGNPDLIVSRTHERPDPADSSTFQWSAQRWHDDAINILPGDPNYCTGECTFYAAVVANTATTYSIVFHMDQPTTIVAGVPQQGNVPASGYNFYALRLNPGYGQVQVSLVSRAGFANMYISNNDDVLPVGTDASTYQVYVPWYRGSQQLVTIEEGDAIGCTPKGVFPRYCTYLIGIQGFSNCSYTISGQINRPDDQQVTALRSGVAQPGQAANQEFQFFRFQVSAQHMDLSVVVSTTSGDPDLYVSTVGLPGLQQYNWSSTHTGGDSISLTDVAVGTYWIGVYGYSAQNSSFSVMATLVDPSADPSGLGDIVQLQDGEQQNAVAAAGKYRYFMVTIPAGFEQLFIAITTLTGDPDVYVRYEPDHPTVLPVADVPDSYGWRSSGEGDDTITIANPTGGVYVIGVLAYAVQSQFSVSAATGQSFQRLADGIPRRGSVTAFKHSYFRVWMDSAYDDLTITVTPFSGDPDLYVTTGDDRDHPNATNAYWKSTAFRSDAVSIGKGSEHSCVKCYYYIAVFGFFPSTFLITANFGNEQHVLEGVPVDGSVTAGGMTRYSFDMSQINGGTVDIDVAATNGLPAIYVSMKNVPTAVQGGYDYKAASSFSGTHLTIDSAAACGLPGAEKPCIMHIGVFGDWSAGYTLLVTLGGGGRNINLINGRSISANLADDKYAYYTMVVPDREMDLIITVQPFSGDSDLYVSNDPTQTQPNATHYKWRARAAGVDSVALHDVEPGNYYIGVHGFSACRYSITGYAYYENVTMVPVRLQDGVPQSSVIGKGDYLYYSFKLSGEHKDLSVTITNSLGDPDLFMSNDGTLPNQTHHQWSSTRFGSDVITVENPVEAEYLIGVFAWSTSVYSLVAVTHESTLELLAGTSFSEDLTQGQSEYFYMTVSDTTQDLTVTVTSLNGDPDLYMSDSVLRPGPGNYTWSATSFRNDSITIPASQLKQQKYYIAVTAFLNCSFTIRASFHPQTSLQEGRPQADAVAVEQSKWYTFQVQYTGADVSVSLTPRSGYVRMFIQRESQPVHDQPDSYAWSSWNPFSAQLIVIAANDTNACPEPASGDDADKFCTYYILVYGVSACDYTITASRGLAGQTLRAGVPVQATVAPGAMQQYKFFANNPEADVTFSVTPLSGNPYMYIVTSAYDSQNLGPSATNFQWKSEMPGGDSLQVTWEDTRFALGEWRLAVFGSTYSSYTVVASASTRSGNVSTIALVDGQPLVGRISLRGGYAYYSYAPSDPSIGINFAVSPRTGDPDLYVAMSPTVPTNQDFTWQASHSGSDLITVNGADPRACGLPSGGGSAGKEPCMFIIGVRAYSPATYVITVTSTMVTGQLQSGVPVFGLAPAGQYVYYFINMLNSNRPDLQISLTAISGDPDLYASKRYEQPNSTFYDWRALTGGSEEFTITQTEKGRYYIGVHAYGWQNASFSLTATFAQPVILSPGQPFSDAISVYGQMRYYTINLDATRGGGLSGLTVALNPSINGRFDMFLLANGTRAGPDDPDNNGWSSLSTSSTAGRNIIVRPDQAHYCTQSNCTYSLAVRAYTYTPLSFTVTYYFGDDIVTLEPAVPFSASVSAGQTAYFRTMVSSFARDISISSTQYLGDVALYAIQSEDFLPGPGNYTWRASVNDTAGTHISIASGSADLQPGYLLVAVVGLSDASFSLTVTNDNTLLVSGSPQSASCGMNGAVQYYFLNFRQPNVTTSTGKVELSDIIFDIAAIRSRVGVPTADQFDLWITTDPAVTKPNATSGQWAAHLADGQQFRIHPDDRYYCLENCTFYVAVSCASGSIRGSYEITASTSDVLEVLAVNTASEAIINAGSAKFYQVYLASATNFSFTLEPCTGEVDLYISSVYNRPDATHNEDSRVNHDRIDEFLYRAAPGTNPVHTLFFGVFEANTQPQESKFQVRAQYVEQVVSTSPLVSNKQLTPVALEKGQVRFSFFPAVSTVGTPSDQLIYSVFWTTDDDASAVLYTQCGVDIVRRRTGFNKNYTMAAGQTAGAFTASLDGLQDKPYQFNVFVYDPSPLSTSGPTAYVLNHAAPNGAAGGDRSGSTSNKIIMGVGIPLGLCVVVLLVYLWNKNRKLTKELSIEMHDVPAAALRKATRGPNAAAGADDGLSEADRAKNFHKLLQEDEPDSSDLYAAPSARVDTGVNEL